MADELKRILYVEDEPDIRTVAVTVLEAIGGFSVVACESGRQAIGAAPAAGADLILLDVMMPQMDGPTTLAALRGIPQTAQTPVIFMTAKVMASEIAQLKALGALDVIAKPFDPMTLAEQLERIWQRWADEQEHARSPVPPPSPETGNELQALYRRYAEQLPGTIGGIEAMFARTRAGGDAGALKSLHRALHSLAGSGETFGFPAIGARAKRVELMLEPHLAGGSLPASVAGDVARELDALKCEAGAAS